MKLFLMSLTLMTCSPLLAAGPNSVKDLHWLSGHWTGIHDGAQMEEVISTPQAGMMLGFSRIVETEKTDFFEFMQFKDTDKGVAFIPSPFGRTGVTFLATSLTARKVVFESPHHDFPQEITYELLDANTLYAKISGKRNGQPLTIEFTFNKASQGDE